MKKIATILGSALLSLAGIQAAQAAVTTYNVVETFFEPATQPNNTIFTGSFSFDDVAKTVTNLTGTLTESMTGGCATISGCPGSYGSVPMTLVNLGHQLSATYDPTLGGLLITTFALSTTNTFYDAGTGDNWTPQTGVDVGGIYYGWPTAKNPFKGGVGNAYAMIFVNTSNPTAALTQGQIDKLAYADCTAGGMMGAVCMTGTTVAGYGSVGTMGGYPVSQTISLAAAAAEGGDVPLPAWSLVLLGSGLLGGIWRRRGSSGACQT